MALKKSQLYPADFNDEGKLGSGKRIQDHLAELSRPANDWYCQRVLVLPNVAETDSR